MKQLFFLSITLFSLAITCSDTTALHAQNKQPNKSSNPIDYDPEGGADNYAGKGNNYHSNYYLHPDFYNSTSNDTLTILSHFSTMQQTTEWSCGNMAVLMALHYLGLWSGETEWQLAEKMHSMTDRSSSGSQPGTACCIADYGTRLSEIYHYLLGIDSLHIVASSFRESYTADDLVKPNDLFPACDVGNLYPTFTSVNAFSDWLTEHLRAGRAILAEWSDWDGHWVCIIGIDTNGTPGFTGDDILILADSYDTSDHWQDGYSIAPLERFFYLWKDRAIAPKPYQLQPFIVVGRR